MIENVVDTDVEVETQSKRLRTESFINSNTSSSKVWECFTEFCRTVEPPQILMDGGKGAVIDRYFWLN